MDEPSINERSEVMSERVMDICAAMIALMLAGAAAAQTAGEANLPNGNAGPSAVAPPHDLTKPSMRANPSAWPDADARACLEFATNPEVITCAERYRPHKRNA
jgi:hypothetical protein